MRLYVILLSSYRRLESGGSSYWMFGSIVNQIQFQFIDFRFFVLLFINVDLQYRSLTYSVNFPLEDTLMPANTPRVKCCNWLLNKFLEQIGHFNGAWTVLSVTCVFLATLWKHPILFQNNNVCIYLTLVDNQIKLLYPWEILMQNNIVQLICEYFKAHHLVF